MFPLKTTRKPQSIPYITYGLVLVNVLVFLWQTTLDSAQLSSLYMTQALVPCESHNLLLPDVWLNSLRSMFLHGGWVHLIGNMVFLTIFGPNVEDYFGKVRYLAFYLLAGFAAGFTHQLLNWNLCIPSIGASGAIYGVMGAFLLLYPATRISTVAFFWRIPVGVVNVQAFYMLLYYFVIDLVNGLMFLSAPTYTANRVAFWTHVGGFAAGLVIAFVMTIFKDPPPVDPFEYMND